MAFPVRIHAIYANALKLCYNTEMSASGFTPRYFTPLEAERITGVARATQANWRRFGFTPRYAGHARYGVFRLSELWAIGLMSERGVGPERARKVAGSVALRIAAHAEASPEAFPGPVGDPSIYRNATPSGGLARFFAWFPSDMIGFGDSLDDLIAGRGLFGWAGGVLPEGGGDLTLPGALIVLDMKSLAGTLLRRAGPLFIEKGRAGRPGSLTDTEAAGSHVPAAAGNNTLQGTSPQ